VDVLTVRAAVLTALNAPLTIAGVGLTELQFGQVLVQIIASGICGAQLAEIRGEKGNAKFLPHLLGHEGCGMVSEVGPGVSRVKVGDRVVMHWRKARGIESPFPRYVYDGRTITSGPITTFSEFSICSENRLTPVPIDTPRELCALLGCGLSTALATIERDAGVRYGEGVMIVGMGGLGVNLLRAARLAHASPIICVDVHESKRKIAEAHGAEFINAATEDYAAGVRKACRCGYEVIIDTAGSKRSIEAALPHLAPSGRFVLVGQPKPGEDITIANANHLFGGEGKLIRATQGGGFRPDDDIPRYIRLWKSGALKLDGIITHRVPLERINDGLNLVRNGEASRVIVEMR
jgi:S-(hydroxymethyl)glutathione dehydrogenase/alcohol dehydrogenase